uniref:Uncharacterized protein n=1 Tax=Timema douglasi TaxID=61478 RepID=A0A7R8Z942_TIMDO|nr:unnamed protein product [Timema douglasi]
MDSYQIDRIKMEWQDIDDDMEDFDDIADVVMDFEVNENKSTKKSKSPRQPDLRYFIKAENFSEHVPNRGKNEQRVWSWYCGYLGRLQSTDIFTWNAPVSQLSVQTHKFLMVQHSSVRIPFTPTNGLVRLNSFNGAIVLVELTSLYSMRVLNLIRMEQSREGDKHRNIEWRNTNEGGQKEEITREINLRGKGGTSILGSPLESLDVEWISQILDRQTDDIAKTTLLVPGGHETSTFIKILSSKFLTISILSFRGVVIKAEFTCAIRDQHEDICLNMVDEVDHSPMPQASDDCILYELLVYSEWKQDPELVILLIAILKPREGRSCVTGRGIPSVKLSPRVLLCSSDGVGFNK